jgi:DNA recombination protein RmuC
MSSTLIPALTLLVGLLIGGLLGSALGAARAMRQQRGRTDEAETRFRELSAAVLSETQSNLVTMNAERLAEFSAASRVEDERRERTVKELVDPVDQKLRELDEKLARLEVVRSRESGELLEILSGLRTMTSSLERETHTLATAMKDNRARGRWGEIQLRRVVELAGMVEHCDFTTQHTLVGPDQRARPDLIVSLPSARSIIVDAKVPMSSYLEAVNAPDEATRSAHLQQHARDVTQHVNDLTKRDYSSYTSDSLDFVVMFVPGDTFLEAAFESNASWFEDSIAKGVFPASPGTLIALLRAIAFGWRQEQLAENAQEVAELGRQLHERIAVLGEKFAGIGRALTTATRAYNDTVASLEGRVLVTTRRFEEHGVKSSKTLPSLEMVDLAPRPLSAAELGAVTLDEPPGADSAPPA